MFIQPLHIACRFAVSLSISARVNIEHCFIEFFGQLALIHLRLPWSVAYSITFTPPLPTNSSTRSMKPLSAATATF